MIIVIASIYIKDDKVQEFIKILNSNVPVVLKEKGCVEYVPTIDFPSGLPPQELNKNVVTIVEKWCCFEDLKSHLSAPHMIAYKENVKDLVEKMSLKILTEA